MIIGEGTNEIQRIVIARASSHGGVSTPRDDDEEPTAHRSWAARGPDRARAGRQRRGRRGGCHAGVLRRERDQARRTRQPDPRPSAGPRFRRSDHRVADGCSARRREGARGRSRDRSRDRGIRRVIVDRTIGGSALVPADLPDYLELVAQTRRRSRSRSVPSASTGRVRILRQRAHPSPRPAGCSRPFRRSRHAGTDEARRLPGAAVGGSSRGARRVRRRQSTERRPVAVHLDVSACEAAIATGPVLQCVSSLLHCTGAIGAKRYGAPAGYFPASDGMVRISAMEDHQWRGLADAYDRQDLVDRWPAAADRIEHGPEIDAEVSALTAGQPKAECEAMLQRTGVPATAAVQPGRAPRVAAIRLPSIPRRVRRRRRQVRALGLPFTTERSGVPSRHVPARVDPRPASCRSRPRARGAVRRGLARGDGRRCREDRGHRSSRHLPTRAPSSTTSPARTTPSTSRWSTTRSAA